MPRPRKLNGADAHEFTREDAAKGGRARAKESVSTDAAAQEAAHEQIAGGLAAKADIPILDETQAQTLLKAAKGSRLYVPILLGYGCGMRRGEVFALRWADVDLEAGTVSVHRSLQETKEGLDVKATKTETGRVIELPAFMTAIVGCLIFLLLLVTRLRKAAATPYRIYRLRRREKRFLAARYLQTLQSVNGHVFKERVRALPDGWLPETGEPRRCLFCGDEVGGFQSLGATPLIRKRGRAGTCSKSTGFHRSAYGSSYCGRACFERTGGCASCLA